MAGGVLRTVGCLEEDAIPRISVFLERPRSYLVDIRAKPWSKFAPEWNRTTLKETYKRRYVHIPGLGNVAPKDQPIQLANPDPHIRDLAKKLRSGTSYLLLCARRNHDACYCQVVVGLLRLELGTTDVSLPPLVHQSGLWQ